jgi:TetR/AcrR family transcriptional regulator
MVKLIFSVMSEKDLSTEQLILEAAKKVFIAKGLDGTRMQEIADEAGINKSLLHYYFRSKDKLFDEIFKEIVMSFAPRVFGILNSPVSLFEKIKLFVDTYLDLLLENPYIPGFLVNEVSRNPSRLVSTLKKNGVNPNIMREQLRKEIAAGIIRPMKVEDLMANLISLCVFPFVAKNIFSSMLDMSDDDYMLFLADRKKEIPIFIINSIMLKNDV